MNRTTDELEITKSLGLSGEVYQGNRWMEHKKIMETLFLNSTTKSWQLFYHLIPLIELKPLNFIDYSIYYLMYINIWR